MANLVRGRLVAFAPPVVNPADGGNAGEAVRLAEPGCDDLTALPAAVRGVSQGRPRGP